MERLRGKILLVCSFTLLLMVVLAVPALANPYAGGWGNCTWSAWQLAYEQLGVELPYWNNAGTWYDSAAAAGMSVGTTPMAPSIVVLTDDGAGHVAYVSQIGDGRIYVIEGGYGNPAGRHEDWMNYPNCGRYYLDASYNKHYQSIRGFIYLSPQKAMLDVNGYLDGTINGGLADYGTFDVYINGGRVADDVNDYYSNITIGSTYEIKDIRATSGHIYNGVYSGSLSGTMTAAGMSTALNFESGATLDVVVAVDGQTVSSAAGIGYFNVKVSGKTVAENQNTSYSTTIKNGVSYEVTACPYDLTAYVITDPANAKYEGTMGPLGRTVWIDFKTIQHALEEPQISVRTEGKKAYIEWTEPPLIDSNDRRVYDLIIGVPGTNVYQVRETGLTVNSYECELAAYDWYVKVTAINDNQREIQTPSTQSFRIWGDLASLDPLNLEVGDSRFWGYQAGTSTDLIVITSVYQKDWMDQIRWEFGDPSVAMTEDYTLYALKSGSTTAKIYFESDPLNAKTFIINVAPSQAMIEADVTPPRLDDCQVTRISPTGYAITYRVSDDVGVSKVVLDALLEGQSVNDGHIETVNLNPSQLSYEGTLEIDIANHENAVDCWYRVYIYVYDNKGNHINSANREARVYIPALIHSTDKLTLPAELHELQASAFEGDLGFGEVVLPEGLETIGSRAFADCSQLSLVYVPDTVTSIAADAFEGCSNVVLKCSIDSTAAEYAHAKDIPYVTEE